MKIFRSENKIFRSPYIFRTIWKPSSLDDMIFWGNSNKKNIIIDEENPQINNIKTWIDISGKINNATQNNFSLQPEYKNDALYFNITNNIQVNLNINYFTIFTLSKISNNNILYEFGDDVSDETGFRLIGTDDNSISVSKNGFSGLATSRNTNDNNWLDNNNLQLICHSYGGTNQSHKLYINNSFIPTTTNYSMNPGDLNLSETLNIGSRSDNSLGIQGYIYEFLIYNRELSYEEIQRVTNYINDKYSVF